MKTGGLMVLAVLPQNLKGLINALLNFLRGIYSEFFNFSR